jgi:hypothetical protein
MCTVEMGGRVRAGFGDAVGVIAAAADDGCCG